MLRLGYELVSLARAWMIRANGCPRPDLSPRRQLLEAWQQISGKQGAGTWDDERPSTVPLRTCRSGLTSVKAATNGPPPYRQRWLLSRAMEYVGPGLSRRCRWPTSFMRPWRSACAISG